MGRKRTKDKDLPARVYLRHGAYFFVDHAGTWTRLGKDKAEALRAYADLLTPGGETFAAVVTRYQRVAMPKKSPKTQADQYHQLVRLVAVFGKLPISSITRAHVARYRDERPPVAGNRELALLSHVFGYAMEWGLRQDNPCEGVRRNKEAPRTRYVTDDEFVAVYDAGPKPVQVMMMLALLTGQREGDLLKLRRQALTNDGIEFTQGKTGKKLLVRWTDALREAVSEALGGPVAGIYVVTQENGQPYSTSGFQTAWQRHMANCMERGLIGERFTFHDLRAKAGTDGPDGRLLGHSDERLLRRIYRRRPEVVNPTR